MSQAPYDSFGARRFIRPNIFDLLALSIILGVLYLLGWSASLMATPYAVGTSVPIELTVPALFGYSLRSFVRMMLAMTLSLIVTFSVGALMAKSSRYRKVLLPLIDVFQSIPPLGVSVFFFLTFLKFFPHSTLSSELASIITTFFAQVWNMIISFYQSLLSTPREIHEASEIFHLSPWQRFWKIDVPRATPALIHNAMISMSTSWFFVVASESIPLPGGDVTIPGIGAFINQAIIQQNQSAMLMAFGAMFVVIFVYDQLLFRPLLAWSERFKADLNDDDAYQTSWFLDLLSRSPLVLLLQNLVIQAIDLLTYPFAILSKSHPRPKHFKKLGGIITWITEYTVYGLGIFFLVFTSYRYLTLFSLYEVLYVFELGLITSVKILTIVLISAAIWLPIGVWIGSNRKVAMHTQPIIQFLAAYPPQMLYPFISAAIIRYNLNVDIWTAPIMVLGTQWYILFNVIAGTMMITKDQRFAAANMGVKSFLLWKRVYFPAVLPYCITGCLSASGGCWNVSLDTDTVEWGGTKISALGISSYIQESFATGALEKAVLGVSVMTCYVLLINRFLWNPLIQRVTAHHR